MNDEIHVIIDSLPKDDFVLLTAIVSGIIIPLIIVFISYFFSIKAEKRAINHADKLQLLNDKAVFINMAQKSLDDLFKSVMSLQYYAAQNSEYKKLVDVPSEGLLKNFFKDEKSQHLSLMWFDHKQSELYLLHNHAIIEAQSSYIKIIHIFNRKYCENLSCIFKEIIKFAKEFNEIDDEITKLNEELSKIMKIAITDDSLWTRTVENMS